MLVSYSLFLKGEHVGTLILISERVLKSYFCGGRHKSTSIGGGVRILNGMV